MVLIIQVFLINCAITKPEKFQNFRNYNSNTMSVEITTIFIKIHNISQSAIKNTDCLLRITPSPFGFLRVNHKYPLRYKDDQPFANLNLWPLVIFLPKISDLLLCNPYEIYDNNMCCSFGKTVMLFLTIYI